MPPEEFTRLGVAIFSVPSIVPPLPPPLPPPALGSAAAAGITSPAEGGHNQCHWDEYCLTADRHAKISFKCGNVAVEASAEDAKVGVERGPVEVSPWVSITLDDKAGAQVELPAADCIGGSRSGPTVARSPI